MKEVTRDRVFLIYQLTWESFTINIGAVIILVMKKAYFHLGCRYDFGGLLTQFLRRYDIKKGCVLHTSVRHAFSRYNPDVRS